MARGRPRLGAHQRLTRSERDIVELVCEGLTNPQIAERLGVSPRTIQGHLLKVFRKFDVSTRAELVAWMLRGMASHKNAPSGAQGSAFATATFNTMDSGRTDIAPGWELGPTND